MYVHLYIYLFICVDDTAVPESLLWLQNNLSPWQLVENHWKVTSTYRQNQIQSSSNKSISYIFAQWPILKHPTAYLLIDEDFKFLQLTSENCMANWFKFFSEIQKICPLKEDKVTIELRSILEIDDVTDSKFTTQKFILQSHEIFIIIRVCFRC